MLNPLFRRLRDLNWEIARAEEHFGMTPLARLRLGVTFLQEPAAKEDLEARRERRRPHLIRQQSPTAARARDVTYDGKVRRLSIVRASAVPAMAWCAAAALQVSGFRDARAAWGLLGFADSGSLPPFSST